VLTRYLYFLISIFTSLECRSVSALAGDECGCGPVLTLFPEKSQVFLMAWSVTVAGHRISNQQNPT